MRIIIALIASVCACVILSSCGPVYIGSAARQAAQNKANAEAAAAANNNTTTETAANTENTAAAEEQTTEAAPNAGVNCDDFMQQLANSCFKAMAFEADGVMPLRMKDASGNDAGEVDQAWATAYCNCYAQMAFQKFGCTTVVSHENLDDATYAATYADVEAACYEISKSNQN